MTRRSSIPPIALAGLAVLLALPAVAHIVQPERLHPVAESYRRSAFLLALNPVSWDQVLADARVIVAGLAEVAPADASVFRAAIEAAVESTASGEPADRQVARELFEQTTRAVAALIAVRLDRAEAALAWRTEAAAELAAARQLWSAFEREIRLTDQAAHVRLGLCWIGLNEALGSPGLGARAGTPADEVSFADDAAEIVDYLRLSYLDRPSPAGRAMLSVPAHSPTFELVAEISHYLPPGSEVNKQLPRPRQILNMAERGVDESETVLIALGDMAFDSPHIFGEPARSLGISCNTCHNKSITNPQLFIPGLSTRPGGVDVDNAFFAPHANDGLLDPLDIPDLRGIRFTAPYGRDGRFDSLRDFTRNVIVNEFNGTEPEPVLLDGMIAYMLQFDFLPNPELRPGGALADSAPEAARRGETLFNQPFQQMAGQSCASCHHPSDHFLDRQRHDIGSVAKSSEGSRDGALDTPTLLSAHYTAPYFHDGSQPTLRGVVEWFDRRYELVLSPDEVSDLTAYLEVIGGGLDPYEDTFYTLEAELEEFSFFLSTADFLRSRAESRLMAITLRTVADELRAHKWDVQDRRLLPTLDRLAELIDEAGRSFAVGDEVTAEQRIADYLALYEQNREQLR